MSSKLDRLIDRYTFNATNALGTTEAVKFSTNAGLILYFPAGWTSCTVTVYALAPNGTYYALNNSAGTAITFTAAASKAYAMSDTVFAADQLKFVTDQASNNTIDIYATGKG